MLESLGQTNIGSLNLEEPQPRLDFNPKVDLTEVDFWNLRQYTADSLVSSRFHKEYILQQFHFNLLSGQRQEDSLETSRNELIWEAVKGRLHEIKSNPKALLSVAGAVKTVFPVRFTTFPWDVETILGIYNSPNFYGLGLPLTDLASFAIAFPEEDISKIKQRRLLFNWNELENIDNPGKIWTYGLENLAGLRILSEEKFKKLNVSNQTLLKMKRGLMEVRDLAYKKKTLSTYENPHWGELLGYGAYLAIICAEKVEITDRGLELTMSEPRADFIKPTPALPETRKF